MTKSSSDISPSAHHLANSRPTRLQKICEQFLKAVTHAYLTPKLMWSIKNEKIIIAAILGLTIIVFSIPILGSIIASQIVEPREIEVVTLYGNGSTETSAVIPEKATVYVAFVGGVQNAQFYFPFVIAGIGMWGPWSAIITGQLPQYHPSIPVLLFWISSMISIPLMVKFTNQIPLWRRIPYIYLTAALIGGLGIFLWTGFGN